MSSLDIQPLPAGQQMLLQRLMANHVMSNDKAKLTVSSLLEEVGENAMGSTENLSQIFSNINQQLNPAFGLEIVTMVDKSGEKAVKYHAVVNTQCDDVAKQYSFEKAFTAHERAFIRLLMQRMVEEGTMKRKDCINLRSTLTKGFKLSLDDAERMVQILLDEEWLRVSARQENSDDEEEEEDGENDEPSQSSRKRQKKKLRRESVQIKMELAPRSFMELSHYLSDLGLEEEDMPQFLFHRR
ncbi:Nse1 non-SMC component of SMC5-6 complex [Nitzschia inconspicua]|uniref:Non-structural maintenance of chromosomes element 1 homolog n=1 Tax=Nitzschia inconspicua TaxID=303405 RepID=A0A9K3PXM5_9STRA|nr:Nse1 non-SMC component of SMC5-6 complex [Nitzschia inconspicua]